MLKAISIATVMVDKLHPVERAYRQQLEYQTVEYGIVSQVLAEQWGAPSAKGSHYCLMQPSSKEPVYLRFIESPLFDSSFISRRTTGWNAIEILAKDPDALASQLEGSQEFEVVGSPAWLSDEENIRAMQATGPSNELIYLTNIRDQESSGFDLDGPTTAVDRIFIMVVGGKNLDELCHFYGHKLGLNVTPPMSMRIRSLSRVYDLPEDTMHDIAIAQLSSRFVLELDQYPEQAVARPTQNGHLPLGICMVSFIVDSLADFELEGFTEARKISGLPYRDNYSLTLSGPSGERIELIENALS